MKIFILLKSYVKAFNCREEVFEPLLRAQPNCEVVYLSRLEELEERIAEVDILLTWQFPARLYDKASKLKAVFTPAAGRDWVEADPSGKVPTFHGDYHGEMISEAFMAMLLYFNNDMHLTAEAQKERRWIRNKLPMRRLLRKQRVLIIGYGRIGAYCAKALSTFGCDIVGMKRNPLSERDELGVRLEALANLDKELQEADHVLLLLPNSAETKHYFDRELFAKMKKSAFLYNFGRGPCVKEADLIEALQEGSIAGAGLDVFEEEPLPRDNPLWLAQNVLMTPHSSCCYEEYLELFLERVIPKLAQFDLK